MNATETIFALALASNVQQQQNFTFAYAQLAQLGKVEFSAIYQIPCRDAVGADYWNSACLLKSELTVDEVLDILKNLASPFRTQKESESLNSGEFITKLSDGANLVDDKPTWEHIYCIIETAEVAK